MMPRRDALRAGSHWHVDCRIEGELPKDDVVSGRFLANILFGGVTLCLFLVFAWLAYQTFKVSGDVRDLGNRITANTPELNKVQALQREYVDEASKVDRAYGTIRPALFVSDFIGVLNRTLPPQMTIDSLVWNDTDVVMRGVVPGSRPVASQILIDYLDKLKKEPSITAQFGGDVNSSGYDAPTGNFKFNFHLQPLPPL